jgi:hypothetical protein
VEVAAVGEGVEATIGVESARRRGSPPSWRKVEAARRRGGSPPSWRPPAVVEEGGGHPPSRRQSTIVETARRRGGRERVEAGEGGSDERGVECGGGFEWRGWSAAGI